MAIQAGISFEPAQGEAAIGYTGPSWGLAVGDFDGDGWMDLYSSNHGSPPRLLRNVGGRFIDVTARALAPSRGDSHGVAWADFDNDGDQDLVELTGAGRGRGRGTNRLLVNERGVLRDRAAAWGVQDPLGRGRTPLWLDFDGDGRLDLLLNNAPRQEAPSRLLMGGERRFEAASADPWKDINSQWGGLFAAPRGPVLAVLGGSGARLVELPANNPWPRVRPVPLPALSDWAASDFDGDGFQDVIGSRGSGAPSVGRVDERRLRAHLPLNGDEKAIEFVSSGEVKFVLEPSSPRWWRPQHVRIGATSMRPSGLFFTLTPDAAEGRPSSSAGSVGGKSIDISYRSVTRTWRVVARATGRETLNLLVESSAPVEEFSAEGFRVDAAGGWLRLFTGPDLNQDEADRGLGGARASRAIAAGDWDNDGDVDLYVVRSDGGGNLPNAVYENDGVGGFAQVVLSQEGEGTRVGTAGTVAVIDADRDGRLDVVSANGSGLAPFNHGPVELLFNQSLAAGWLAVELHGVTSNRNGIGTALHLQTGLGRQTRVRGGEMHAASQDQPTVHFGLGESAASSLVVEWPSGMVQRFISPPSDHTLHIVEPVLDD